MKPHKYRGKTKEGKWVDGYYLVINKKHYICSENFVPTGIYFVTKPNGEQINIMSHLLSGLIEVIPETVGQATGLKDKNGKEIYEGDVVKVIRHNNYENTYPVKWDDKYKGIFIDNDCIIEFHDREHQIEIIGTIHDNSEAVSDKATDGPAS